MPELLTTSPTDRPLPTGMVRLCAPALKVMPDRLVMALVERLVSPALFWRTAMLPFGTVPLLQFAPMLKSAPGPCQTG